MKEGKKVKGDQLNWRDSISIKDGHFFIWDESRIETPIDFLLEDIAATDWEVTEENDLTKVAGSPLPQGRGMKATDTMGTLFPKGTERFTALEIKRLCLQKIRQELPEYKHLETEALPIWQLLSMKNEAPCES